MGRTPELGSYDRGDTPTRVKLAGSVAMTLLTVPGLAAIISACGGGDGTASTQEPNGTSQPTAAVTAEPTTIATIEPTIAVTPEPTLAPTPEPTPEPTKAPVIPTFDEMVASVEVGFASVGAEISDKYRRRLANCNEMGLEGEHPDVYPFAVLDGCGNVGQAIIELLHATPTPELEYALNQIRDYTLGDGGKFDQLIESGKLKGITDVKNFKPTYNANFFTP